MNRRRKKRTAAIWFVDEAGVSVTILVLDIEIYKAQFSLVHEYRRQVFA